MKCSMMMVQIPVIVCVSAMFLGCGQVSTSSTPEKPAKISSEGTIGAECIVNYYRSNKSPYITEQQHTFGAETGYLSITSREPYGSFRYVLKKNQFTSTKRSRKGLSDLDVDFCDKKLATAIFYSFSGGANLLKTGLYATSDNVKVEGQWYQPYQPDWPSGELQVTLFQGITSDRIELVQISDSETGQTWLIRSYNLRYSNKLERLLPRKIDIFDISAGIASKELVVQIDYKQIQITQQSGLTEENNG